MSAITPLSRHYGLLAGVFVAVFVLGASAGVAQQIPPLGTFNDGGAFRLTSGSVPICYIGSLPNRSVGAVGQRAITYVQVTHRPAAKAFDVVSVTAGYTYQPGSQVEVDIDGKDFSMFTKGGYAWTKDNARDVELVAAMRRGRQMTVRGTSARGTLTTDTYSLAGFTAARNAIDLACPGK